MTLTDEDKEKYAIQLIIAYKDNPSVVNEDYVRNNYMLAVKMLIDRIDNIATRDNSISSISQGDNSVSFNNDTSNFIDNNIIALIGPPYLHMY